jgi:hypothetical protein
MIQKKTWIGVLGLSMALGLSACADEPTSDKPSSEGEQQGELGSLSLQLIGSDTSGRSYRLREGNFFVTGYGGGYYDGGSGYSKWLSSETDLDASTIVERLVPGDYSVELTPGWYLERYTDGSWLPVEQAVLLSSAQQWAYIYNNGISRVAYRFGVDGELIDFRSGELQIGIEIEQPGDEPPCEWWPWFPAFPCPNPDGGMGWGDAGVGEADAGPGGDGDWVGDGDSDF